MRRAVRTGPDPPSGWPLCLGPMMARDEAGVEPSSARRRWRSRSSSTGRASGASAASSTAAAGSLAGGTAATVRPLRRRSESGEPGSDTGSRPRGRNNTETKKPSDESGSSLSAWGIAASSRQRTAYKCWLRRRRTRAPRRDQAMPLPVSLAASSHSSGCWWPGPSCSPPRRSCWARWWRARGADAEVSWRGWSRSTAGTRRTSDE